MHDSLVDAGSQPLKILIMMMPLHTGSLVSYAQINRLLELDDG